MRIERSTTQHGSMLPEALSVIASVPDTMLHHISYARRHPASLYARSLEKIANAWNNALDNIDAFTFAYIWKQDDSDLPAAVEAYQALLHLLYEHLDVSYGCLRALVPPQGAKDALLDTHFLDKAKLEGWREFRLRIRPYTQDRIGAIVNSLKHNQSELASFYLHNLPDLRAGYYVRDVLPSGALGPAPRIHAGGNSAFSFARDTLVHFWNLYYVSNELASVMRRQIRVAGPAVAIKNTHESLNSKWEALARRISDIPLAFFPDEVHMPVPLVRWNSLKRQLTIQMPSAVRPRRLPNGYQMRTAINIDMAHPTNKVPYFGKNAA